MVDGSSQTLAVGERAHTLSVAELDDDGAGGLAVSRHDLQRRWSVPACQRCSRLGYILVPWVIDAAHTEQPDGTPGRLQQLATGGVNFLFADGSIRFIKNSVDYRTLFRWPRAGGEVVSSDQF